MTRRCTFALVSALLMSACSVELAGQGEVTPDDPAVAPHGDVPPRATQGGMPGAPAASPGSSDGGGSSSDGGGSSGDGGGSARDAGASSSVPEADAAVADAARADAAPADKDAGLPGQPSIPAMPDARADDAETKPIDVPAPFVLTSPAFTAGAKIPSVHTCNGADLSPAFAWQGVPADTTSFVMLLTTHTDWFGNQVEWQRWVMWNIPATRMGLPASIEEGHTPSDVPGAIQASNESESVGDWAAGGTFGGGGSGGPGGSFSGSGGSMAGAGGSQGGGSSEDERVGRRYRGPCSYGRPQTFEFTLFALGKSPPPPAWELDITTDEIVSWLKRDANVLGKAVLDGVAP